MPKKATILKHSLDLFSSISDAFDEMFVEEDSESDDCLLPEDSASAAAHAHDNYGHAKPEEEIDKFKICVPEKDHECEEGMTELNGYIICKHCGLNLRKIK